VAASFEVAAVNSINSDKDIHSFLLKNRFYLHYLFFLPESCGSSWLLRLYVIYDHAIKLIYNVVSSKDAALKCKSIYCFAGNQNNVSEWSHMFFSGLLFQ